MKLVPGQERSDETEDNDIVCFDSLRDQEQAERRGRLEAVSGVLRIYYGEFDPGSG